MKFLSKQLRVHLGIINSTKNSLIFFIFPRKNWIYFYSCLSTFELSIESEFVCCIKIVLYQFLGLIFVSSFNFITERSVFWLRGSNSDFGAVFLHVYNFNYFYLIYRWKNKSSRSSQKSFLKVLSNKLQPIELQLYRV